MLDVKNDTFRPGDPFTKEEAICAFVRILYKYKSDGTVKIRGILRVRTVIRDLTISAKSVQFNKGDLKDYKDIVDFLLEYQDNSSAAKIKNALQQRKSMSVTTAFKVKVDIKIVKDGFSLIFTKAK